MPTSVFFFSPEAAAKGWACELTVGAQSVLVESHRPGRESTESPALLLLSPENRSTALVIASC